MNKQFTDEQIKAYAARFREGDAIWCNGKWREVVGSNSRGLTCESSNRYVIHCFDGDVAIGGFKEREVAYRVTTLERYELQGGEKIVWLGEGNSFFTFGKVYEVDSDGRYRDDAGDLLTAKSSLWGIIPRYEQVKNLGKTTITEKVNEVVASKMNKEKEDDEVREIKVVEESKYTGKFKVGDDVRVAGLIKLEDITYLINKTGVTDFINITGVIDYVYPNSNSFPYRVLFKGCREYISFNEAEIELVNPPIEREENVSDEQFDELLNTIDDILKPVESTTDRVNELKLKTYEVVMGKSSHSEIIDELKDIAHIDINNGRYDDAIKAIELIKEWQQHGE